MAEQVTTETDVKTLQKTLTQAVLSPEDRSDVITTSVKGLHEIARERPDTEMETKKAVAGALDEGLRYAHNTGNFKTLLAQAATDEQLTVLDGIANAREIGRDEKLMAAKENFLEKAKLLSDSAAKAKPEDVETLVAQSAGICDPVIFPFILAHTSNPQKLEQGLQEAAAGVGTLDNFAGQNIQAILEKHTVTDKALLEALEGSIAKAGIPQFDVLVEKVRSRNPTLLNQGAKDGKSLYEKVICDRGANIDLRATMIERMLKAGITPPPIVGGINIINAMELEGFPPNLRNAVEAMVDGRDRENLHRSYRDISPRRQPLPAEKPEQKPGEKAVGEWER